MVCLHGFMDTWRTWELVLPALERGHDVAALTLPGHAGGPHLGGPFNEARLLDAIEAALDDAGIATAHLVGNSLGGYLALRLAARGRAHTVVALAPAGGWANTDASFGDILRFQIGLREQLKAAAPHVDSLLATPEGRRRATELLTVNYEHIPTELLTHLLLGVAGCTAVEHLDGAVDLDCSWQLDAERVTCPVRIVWGTADRLLTWPHAAARYRRDWLPHADWIVLDDVGHYPQLDVPLETAQLILGFTA
jgi:pimeloyl-ACP methyl ester carboxylesterase